MLDNSVKILIKLNILELRFVLQLFPKKVSSQWNVRIHPLSLVVRINNAYGENNEET